MQGCEGQRAGIRILSQRPGIIRRQPPQRAVAGGAEQQRGTFSAAIRIGEARVERVGQRGDDHMAVGAANTKGGDARIAHFVLPCLCRHRYGKGALFKFQCRVGGVKIQ